MIEAINFAGMDLKTAVYGFDLTGLFTGDKDVITSDVYGDGEIFGRSKLKPKKPVLGGIVLSNDPADILALGKLRAGNYLKTLIVNMSEYGQLIGYAEVTNLAWGSSPRLVTFQLLMPDPYLYAAVPVVLQLGANGNAGRSFPYTYPISYGGSSGGSGVLSNPGNSDAYPVITIVGTCSAITVSNITTGESVSVNVSLSDSDSLVIDCTPSNRGVYLNGVENMALKPGVGWIHCEPGDNVLSFSRNSLQNKKHCAISLKARYV